MNFVSHQALPMSDCILTLGVSLHYSFQRHWYFQGLSSVHHMLNWVSVVTRVKQERWYRARAEEATDSLLLVGSSVSEVILKDFISSLVFLLQSMVKRKVLTEVEV